MMSIKKLSWKTRRGERKCFSLACRSFLYFGAFALVVPLDGCDTSGSDSGINRANSGGDNAIVGNDATVMGGNAEDGSGGAGMGGLSSGGSRGTQPSNRDFTDGAVPDSSDTPTDARVSLIEDAAESSEVADANEDPDAEAASDDEGINSDALVDGEIELCADCCADGFERGIASSSARLVAKLTNSPEGVTVCPNGDVFVAPTGLFSDHGEIVRVPLDGSEPEIWVSYTGRLFTGLTCDRKNRIFATGLDLNDPAYVVMVTAKDDPGTPLPVPSGNTQLLGGNGIVAIDRPEGLLIYASDNTTNLIALWKELPNGQFEATIAATDVVGANGLDYDPKTNKLYAGGSQANNVTSFEVAQDGSLGAPQVVWTRSETGYVDGITIDENGDIYVASWTTGEVLRTSDEKVITTDIVNPTSFAFRGGTLLITDFKILAGLEGGLYAIDLGVCGAKDIRSPRKYHLLRNY